MDKWLLLEFTRFLYVVLWTPKQDFEVNFDLCDLTQLDSLCIRELENLRDTERMEYTYVSKVQTALVFAYYST